MGKLQKKELKLLSGGGEYSASDGQLAMSSTNPFPDNSYICYNLGDLMPIRKLTRDGRVPNFIVELQVWDQTNFPADLIATPTKLQVSY